MNRAGFSTGALSAALRSDPTSELVRVEQSSGWSYWWIGTETEVQARPIDPELVRVWFDRYRRPGDILCELVARAILRTTFARRQPLASVGTTADTYAIAVRQIQPHRQDVWTYGVELDWEPVFKLTPRAP